MSTEFFNDQWRIPSNENQNKVSNYSMDFDGTSDFINCGDSDNLSFGNGSTDSPFSISAWVNMTDATSFVTIAKDATSNREYVIRTLTDDKLYFYLLDNVNGGYIGRISSGTVTSYQGTWIHTVYTYNGNSSSSGIKIYLNGSAVDNADYQGGSYTAMSNTTTNLNIGRQEQGGIYANGKIDQVTIFDYELSQDQVTQLGAEGYAFNFNGINNYVDISNITSLNSQSAFSTSFWTNPQGTLTNVPVVLAGGISSTNRFYIQLLNSTTIRYVSSGSSGNIVDVTVPLILDGNWHHIATAHSGTSLDVYFDGVKINSSPLTITAVSANIGDNFTIGAYFTRASNFFNGELSNTTVFNTGLTSPQVQTLYNNGKPLADMSSFTSLQGWWKLDDTATFNSSWNIPDASFNSNTGTSVGMNASNLVASNINGELIANPMITSPKPIAYYQLGDQSVSTGPTSDYLVPNNSLSDFVFSFDGNNDYIDLGDSDVFSFGNGTTDSPFSISAWVNMVDATRFRIVNKGSNFSNDYEYVFTTSGSDLLALNLYDSSTSARIARQYTTALTSFQGQWIHLAASYDGSETSNGIKLYLNGSILVTASNDLNPENYTAMENGTNPLLIGASLQSGGNFSNGQISNTAIFSTELTSTQIETIYNNGAPSDISSLSPVAWYKLNAADTFDGSNWTIKDYAGSNDGTSSGMDSSNLVVSDLNKTSGYSPYALNFDGTNQEFDIPNVSTLELYNTDFTISFWCKVDASVTNPMFFEKYTGGGGWSLYVFNDLLRFYNGSSWTYISGAFQTVYADLWTNVTIVGDLASTNLKCYINNNQVHSSTNALIQVQNTDILTMAGSNGSAFSYAGGLSNVAIWSGTALSAAEVTEVYNQGVPSDLNTFSGNKPNHWWQMGSNSSFNSSSWTCLDEGISASTSPLTSAVSTANMTNDDIIDGPGYSASGLGTSSIDIKGDAPYSTANGLSENMDVLDRTTDVPS